jgi:hypothetical protein
VLLFGGHQALAHETYDSGRVPSNTGFRIVEAVQVSKQRRVRATLLYLEFKFRVATQGKYLDPTGTDGEFF